MQFFEGAQKTRRVRRRGGGAHRFEFLVPLVDEGVPGLCVPHLEEHRARRALLVSNVDRDEHVCLVAEAGRRDDILPLILSPALPLAQPAQREHEPVLASPWHCPVW